MSKIEKERPETEKWSEGFGRMNSPTVKKFFAIFFEGKEVLGIENEFMVEKF